MFVLFYLQWFVGGLMSYLYYLCLFGHSDVLRKLCCDFCFVFLRLVYPMLPVSLYCLFLLCLSSSYVPYVASFSVLSIFALFFFVLCSLRCQFLWIVHLWWSLRYSLTFIYFTSVIASILLEEFVSKKYHRFRHCMKHINIWFHTQKQMLINFI